MSSTDNNSNNNSNNTDNHLLLSYGESRLQITGRMLSENGKMILQGGVIMVGGIVVCSFFKNVAGPVAVKVAASRTVGAATTEILTKRIQVLELDNNILRQDVATMRLGQQVLFQSIMPASSRNLNNQPSLSEAVVKGMEEYEKILKESDDGNKK